MSLKKNNKINITFKVSRTLVVKYYMVDPYWTLINFTINIRKKIKDDLNIENAVLIPNNRQNNYLIPEDAPELEYSDIFLHEMYGKKLDVFFYINNRTEYNNLYKDNLLNECIVCYEELNTIRYFGCRHYICNICISLCLKSNHNKCPLCRQNLK